MDSIKELVHARRKLACWFRDGLPDP